jgi:hypothetical protein
MANGPPRGNAVAMQGFQFWFNSRPSLQYTKAVLDVLEGDALDEARQHLSIGWMGLRLHGAGA